MTETAALRIERIELREIGMPLKLPFATSFGSTSVRRIMIIRVFDATGAIGYGEGTAPEEPFFNYETIDTAWLIISKYIAPMLAHRPVSSASGVSAALSRIRGNCMAKGGIEAAIWDLEARIAGQPLWRHLGGTRTEIPCGVSIGLQSSAAGLLEKVALELESGYQRIKIKIQPGEDIALAEAVRGKFPDIALSVDANSAYTLRDADLLRQLDQYKLMMIEQPLTPGDIIDHAKLQQQLATPICLDESILNETDARQAIEADACRIINIKLGRVGGHLEAQRIQGYALENGIPVWCGGMLESGIGRAHNIAMSTQAGFSLPGDVSASARYWERDIIDPPVTVSEKGTILPPSGPGIGFNVDEDRIEAMTVRREVIDLN